MEERIQKIISAAGLMSRRAAEKLIAAGGVRVNGTLAALGDKADATRDQITVNGKALAPPEEKVYIMLINVIYNNHYSLLLYRLFLI